MSIGYYTVVYRVDGDKAKHDEWWQAMRPLFMADAQPISITTIAKCDATAQLDRIREVVEQPGKYADMVEAVREALMARKADLEGQPRSSPDAQKYAWLEGYDR